MRVSDLWAELGRVVTEFLRSVTLEDLCERQKGKDESAALTYHV
jgi:DNA-binding IscR family transcriptional regulator